MEPGKLRSAKDGPFAWASKEALRMIGEHFAESNKVPSARSVYLALCELASNEQAERFQVKIATIARFAGVSTRTAHDVLPELELIKVVGIERQTIPGSKMDAPSFYTLSMVCNGCIPLGNNCVAVCNGPEQSSVAENLKNLEKNTEKKNAEETISSPSAARKNKLVGPSDLVVEEIYQIYPRKKKPVDARRAISKAVNHIVATRHFDGQSADVQAAVSWLKTRVQAYAISRKGEDQQYTLYPASWFNAGSYDEDFTPPALGKPPAKDYFAKTDRNKRTANEKGISDYTEVGTVEWHAAKRARECPEPKLPPRFIDINDQPPAKPSYF